MQRDQSLDILRGIAMVFVVMGHSGAPFTEFIYSFHVPLFFILSGYLFKGFSPNKLWPRIKKKIIRLYLPCLLMSVFLILTNNLFIDWNILCTEESLADLQGTNFIPVVRYSTITDYIVNLLKALTFTWGGQLSGALWFLRVMFISSIIFDVEYLLVNRLFTRHKVTIHTVMNLILFCLGYMLSTKSLHIPGSFEIVFTILIFYNIGQWMQEIINYKFRVNNGAKVMLFVLFTLLLVLVAKYEVADIARNKYSNPALLLLSSVVGFGITYFLSKFLSNFRYSGIFAYIGKNTVCIMCWHFIAFKIVNYIIVKIDELPNINIAQFPIIEPSYWLAYIVVGLLIPLAFAFFYNYILQKYESR